MSISVVVLCGGLGTRIRSSIGCIPKILAPIGTTPFIDFLISWLQFTLRSYDFEIILATGYLSEQVDSYVHNREFNIKLCPESQPLGTLGALHNCLSKASFDHLLVVNGDTLFDCQFDLFINDYFSDSLPRLVLKECSSSSHHSGFIYSSSLKRLQISSSPDYISMGCFIISRSDLLSISNLSLPHELSRPMIDIDLLPHIPLVPFVLPLNSSFLDIGTHESYSSSINFINTFFQGNNVH